MSWRNSDHARAAALPRDAAWCAVLAGAALLRAALAITGAALRGDGAFLSRDSAQYLALAESLSAGGGFATAAGPEVFRTPGYPALLSIVAWLNASPGLVVAIQVGLAVATVALVMRVVRALGGDRRAALAAGWCAAIDPVLVFWTVKVMPETAWTLALTALMLVLVRQLAVPRAWSVLACGALLATQAYLKPAGYYLAPVVVVLLAVTGGGQRRRRLASAVVAAAVFAALVAPWHLRNARQAGFVGFSTLADRAVYLSAGASVASVRGDTPFVEFRERRRAEVLAEFGSDAAAAAAMRARGLEELRASPVSYARLHASGMLRTLLDPGAVEYLRYVGAYPESGGLLMRLSDRGLLQVLAEVWHARPVLILLNAAFGAWLVALLAAAARGVGRAPRAGAAVMTSVALYFVLVSGGVHASSRFRHPVVPALAVLAGLGWSAMGGGRSASAAARAEAGCLMR